MTTREVVAYAERLNLSDEQRHAGLAFHDQYLTDARALREGAIEKFLKDRRKASEDGMTYQREVIEDFIERQEKMFSRIAALDESFFRQLQSILTEGQLATLPRVRLARERERYQIDSVHTQFHQFGGVGRHLFQGDVLKRSGLSDADQAAIDPFMAPYERRITEALRGLYETVIRSDLDYLAALHARGFREEMLGNEDEREALSQIEYDARSDQCNLVTQEDQKVKQLNLETVRILVNHLPPDLARDLRYRFYGWAYGLSTLPFRYHPGVFASPDLFQAALLLKELTAEQREALLLAREDVHRKLEALVEEEMSWRADFERDLRQAGGMDEEASNSHNAMHQRLIDDSAELWRQVETTVKAILGEELFQAAVAYQKRKGEEEIQARTARQDRLRPAAYHADPSYRKTKPVHWLPLPIDETDILFYGRILGFNDEQQAILEAMHRDYMEAYETAAKPIVDASVKVWNYFHGSGSESGYTLDEAEEALLKAQQVIRSSDAKFFDEIEAVLPEPDSERTVPLLRLMRERDVWHLGYERFSQGGNVTTLDLARLAAAHQITRHNRRQLPAILEEYEHAVVSVLRDQFTRMLESSRAYAFFIDEQTRLSGDPTKGVELMENGRKWRELWSTFYRDSRRASRTIAERNTATLEKLVQQLPEEIAAEFREIFTQISYPDVYSDPFAIHRELAAASQLDDLTDRQRSTLTDLALAYRSAYDEFCRQLTDLKFQWVGVESYDEHAWAAQKNAIALLDFYRHELNCKAIMTLKEIVSEEQLGRIGRLPDLDDDRYEIGL